MVTIVRGLLPTREYLDLQIVVNINVNDPETTVPLNSTSRWRYPGRCPSTPTLDRQTHHVIYTIVGIQVPQNDEGELLLNI